MRITFCLSVLVSIATGLPTDAFAQEFDSAGRAKLAEMMAFIREAPELCGQVPSEWVFEALAEDMAAGEKAPAEEEIADKQDELRALKAKLGISKWCALYFVEMQEADIVAHLSY